MPCILIVKNTENSFATGMVIDALFIDAYLSGQLCKRKWVSDGNTPESFNRAFVKVICTDRDVLDSDIQNLLEVGIDGRRSHRIKPQGVESPFHAALLEWAEVTVDWSSISGLIEIYNGN